MSDPDRLSRVARMVLALRQAGVTEPRVMEAIEKTPREPFLSPALAEAAYDDVSLPIDCGQSLSRPVDVGLMLQALDLRRDSVTLEVGTGTGYLAAVVSRLGRRVYTMERYRTLASQAEANFNALGIERIQVRVADGRLGWPQAAPFDRIVLSGAVSEAPEALLAQLASPGILVAPLARGEVQSIIRFDRDSAGETTERVIGRGRFSPLEHGVAREL